MAFALDAKLGEIIRSTSELLIGQMRLTWWRDILTKDPAERPAGEPLLELLSPVEAAGQNPEPLIRMIEGWEMLLEDFPWEDRQFANYAESRGEGLFGFSAGDQYRLNDQQKLAAQSWTFWDFARHCSDEGMREEAFARCCELHGKWQAVTFDRSGRPLSILCQIVARDVRKGELNANIYTPSVAGRIIWHGLTGR
ncbi:hypothetical protein [Parasphingorhabdus marina]|uniref:hypothetical protein n=1 Tax=Parasphingorhabdus marina TaxID=394732 RepID=UPI0019521F8A|nr:hypothetical protein [Parasphingorhabdus marina]